MASPSSEQAGQPTIPALFTGFFGIGIVGFGGVLPWVRRMMVEDRRWVNAAEFNDMLALCQFLPGPNVVNVAVATGARFRGVPGSLACLLGLLAAPFAIVIALGGVYERYGHIPVVARAFGGLAAAASGLGVALAVKVAAPVARHRAGGAGARLACVAIAGFRTPLLPTMLVLAPLSVALCRRWPG